MNSWLCRWLVISTFLLCASGAWAQCSAPASDQKSIAALKQQAAGGSAASECGLGLMYDMGMGVPQDFTQAAFWLGKAAEQGVPDAEGPLGVLYRNGLGVEQDYTKARFWLSKAAEQGETRAQTALGLLYALGNGMPRDYAEAYFWFDLAAAGKPDAPDPDSAAAKDRDQAASMLTPADLSRVQERVRKWLEDHPAKLQ